MAVPISEVVGGESLLPVVVAVGGIVLVMLVMILIRGSGSSKCIILVCVMEEAVTLSIINSLFMVVVHVMQYPGECVAAGEVQATDSTNLLQETRCLSIAKDRSFPTTVWRIQ